MELIKFISIYSILTLSIIGYGFLFSCYFTKFNNINLSNIDGSGPSGRVIKRDFEKSLEQDQQFITSSKYEIVEPSSIRKIIAERTTQTKNTGPHFY